jgi:hypothetical protein
MEVEIAVLLLFQKGSGGATGSRARGRGRTAQQQWLATKGTPVHDDLLPCGNIGPRRGVYLSLAARQRGSAAHGTAMASTKAGHLIGSDRTRAGIPSGG